MCKRTVLFVMTAFLMNLFVLSVRADDVSIGNDSGKTVKFRVVVPSTGYDETRLWNSGQVQNAIGTDLWHNAVVNIYELDPKTDAVICAVTIDEHTSPAHLYLPDVSFIHGKYPVCPYSTNLPENCNCFDHRIGESCMRACYVSNAQVIVNPFPAPSGE